MSALPPSGRLLDRHGSIAIVKHRILIPAVVNALPGGLGFHQCDRHLRIVDVAPGVVYYVPLPERLAGELADALKQEQPADNHTPIRKVPSHVHD